MHPIDLFHLFPAGQGTIARGAVIQRVLAGLTSLGLKTESHATGCNFYARCGNPGPEAPVFEAHYDVANVASENCQDNTASVCHLLALAHNPNFHGFVAFCDGEETTNFSTAGARWLNETLVDNMEGKDAFFLSHDRVVLCLELTANGDVIWADNRLASQFGIHQFRKCPFNNATILRAHGAAAAQVSLTPSGQFNSHYPANWKLCHSSADQFVLANRADMSRFQDWLLTCSRPAVQSHPTAPSGNIEG